MDNYESLKLKNQLCFPLYVCSKEIIGKYKEHLDKLDLTYTQYITMMALWEENEIIVTELGKKLYLDSGTLTPLLKKLEAKGYILRTRSTKDERTLVISLTDEGLNLREKAKDIPSEIAKCADLEPEEAIVLYKVLNKMIESFK